MRIRLRQPRSPEEEAEFYAARYPSGYNYRIWPDHVERIVASAASIHSHWPRPVNPVVADLSCGDGSLALSLQLPGDPAQFVLGDLNSGGNLVGPGELLDIAGPLDVTVPLVLSEHDPADLYVCSETLEHLDNPEKVLELLRPRARALFVSTPCGETAADNAEHYWGWDQTGVRNLLESAGWAPRAWTLFTPRSRSPYTFQFWMCT